MSGPGLMTRDHWCVAHDDEVDLGVAASRYLSEGLAGGDQVGLYGWGSFEELRAQLSGLGDVDELIDVGAAGVRSLAERFRPDVPPDPAALMGYWADATEEALSAGFAGLRVVADTTPWAGLRPEQRAVFLHGEQLVNRYRHRKPFTLICACDATAVPAEALEETASIHPLREGVSTPFCLYATDTDVAVQGELDALAVSRLERVLDSLPPDDAGDQLVIDASGLRFVEHRSFYALERHAERRGLSAVVLRRAPRVAERIAGLLDLRRVRLEGPA